MVASLNASDETNAPASKPAGLITLRNVLTADLKDIWGCTQADEVDSAEDQPLPP